MQGFLHGKKLLGDNGAPTPKSGKKARLTLALPRGKADLEAQARRSRDTERGLVDREKVTPWQITPEMRKQCDAMPKDAIVSVDMPSAMGKVVKNMTKRAWRPGDPDGSEPYALPSWQEAAERVEVVATKPARPPRGNRPRPAWKDASEVDFKVVRIKSFVLKK
jgi:hypothetical protein